MLYILATSPVDATAYAAKVLNIPLRRQVLECHLICRIEDIPARFSPDDKIRPTPEFENLARARHDSWALPPDWSRTQMVSDQLSRSQAARLATKVRMHGGKIRSAYDVPEDLTLESIERWLAEEP